jgi:hypothetical protein
MKFLQFVLSEQSLQFALKFFSDSLGMAEGTRGAVRTPRPNAVEAPHL